MKTSLNRDGMLLRRVRSFITGSFESVGSYFLYFGRSRDGNAAVLFGMAAIPVMLIIGAAIDYGRQNHSSTNLQVAVDAAALATIPIASSSTAEQIQKAAQNTFLANFNTSQAINMAVSANYSPTSGILTVSASGGNPTTLMNLASISQTTISAAAKAKMSGGPLFPVCVMVTDPDSNHTLRTSGTSGINFNHCMVQVNTQNWDAVEADQTSYIHSTNGDNCYVGLIHFGDITPPKDPVCNLLPDPFAGISMPSSAATCGNGLTNLQVKTSGTVLQPGTYCQGLLIQNVSSVTFSPGVYVINGGSLKILGSRSSSANVTATGVTFLLTGRNAGVDIEEVNLTMSPATNAGQFSGFLFFLDQTSASNGNPVYGKSSTFKNVAMNTAGSIYLAGQIMNITGASVLTLNPGSIIAGMIEPADSALLNLTGDLNSPYSALNQLQKVGYGAGSPVLIK